MGYLLKTVLILITVLYIIIQIYFYTRSIAFYKVYFQIFEPKVPLFCHSLQVWETLPEIQKENVEKDKSIFFLETTCKSYENGQLWLNSRQACAVESAALANSNRNVYLVFASPGVFYDDKSESNRILADLMSYPNVHLVYVDVYKLVVGSPVEVLWNTSKVWNSKYLVNNISNILRLLLLWKYGGIYLDLDTITLKSLEKLPLNFAGAEDKEHMNNAVLAFSSDGVGHEHVTSCLHDLATHYQGNKWGANGPYIISRLVSRICNGSILQLVGKTCNDFHIFPAKVFYPIFYSDWEQLYDPKQIDNLRLRTNESYIIHLWNKLSSSKTISMNKKTPYLDFARKFCPKTVRNVDKIF